MKKISLLISVVSITCFLSQFGVSQSSHDSEVRRVEIGGQFTYLRRTVPDASALAFQTAFPNSPRPAAPHVSEFGFGARFTYNVTKHIGLEAEYNVFPEDKTSSRTGGFQFRYFELGGKKFQAVFGPKIGYRGSKIGVFGKLRPGYIRLDRYLVVQHLVITPTSYSSSASNMHDLNFFNLDVGGVFEYYPSPRTIVRIDVNPTI